MNERETIELKLDETNELLFKVTIQGADTTPARVRLVCEAEGDVSYMFEGHSTDDGEIRFTIPEMKNSLKESFMYTGRVEVLVENRYFSPIEFDMTFKQSMKVVAESVKVTQKSAVKQAVVVSATIQKTTPVAIQTPSIPKPVTTIQQTKKQSSSLAEKFNKKPIIETQQKSVTGLTEAEMGEVARSAVRKLLQ